MTGECSAGIASTLVLRAQAHGRIRMSVEGIQAENTERILTAAAFLWCPEERNPTTIQTRGPCLKPGALGKYGGQGT